MQPLSRCFSLGPVQSGRDQFPTLSPLHAAYPLCRPTDGLVPHEGLPLGECRLHYCLSNIFFPRMITPSFSFSLRHSILTLGHSYCLSPDLIHQEHVLLRDRAWNGPQFSRSEFTLGSCRVNILLSDAPLDSPSRQRARQEGWRL